VLVLRPGALGDTLLAVPALRALRATFGPLRLAAHGGAARLLASVGEVDAGVAFDDPSLAWLFASVQRPRTEEIVAWMNPDRAPGLRGALLVAPSRPEGVAQHTAQYLLESLEPLGISAQLDERPLDVRPLVSAEILVHPGSGSPTKNWPAQRFAETIRALDVPVRLVVGEADTEVALAIESLLGHPLPRLQGRPLDDLAARLAGARAYLGNDSGVSHLAGLCGARSVVLFGPTSPTVWRPLGPRVTVVAFDTPIERVVALLQDELSALT
jgi:heptosyltransferase-3